MADYTEAQLKAAAKKALADGNIKAAQELADAAMALAKNMKPAAESNVVATTEDGGRIIKGADGQLSFTSPAYSTNDPEKVAKLMEGATAAETSMSSFDQSTIAQNPIASAAAKVVQGVPFVGQYADEAVGMVSDKAGEAMRASQNAMDRENPIASTGLEIAGGIIGSIPMAMAAGPKIVAAAPKALFARALAGVGAGGAAGATEGFVSGYGRGTEGNRMETATRDAKIGGAFGAGIGALGPFASEGIQAIAKRVKGMDVKAIAKTFGISEDAARALKPDLEALDFTSAQRNLDTAGADAMVADAGISTREALDGAITGGGKAARIGTDAVAARAASAGTKLGRVMDLMLGAPEGVKSAAKSIATRTAPARKKAYDLAYASAIDYAAPTGRAIEDVLDRIPPRIMNTAIEEANDAMRAAGIKNMQIMAEIAQDGTVKFREMPNVQQLDEIKKALGVVLQKETEEVTGKVSAAGIRARELARDLKTALGDAVDPYKRAVKLGGDKIAEDQAMNMGRNLFSPATTRETVVETMKGASVEAQEAARRGIRTYIDDTLARVRRSVDDPNADTTETLRLLNTLSTRDAREKLTAVLGSAKAERLLKEIDAAGKQFGTRQAIATGSATGRREARSRALDDTLAPGIVGNAAKGKVPATMGSVVQFLTRATPQADLARKQEVLAEVATALTSMRGKQAQDALALVEKAIAGQPLKDEQAAMIGRLLSSGGALAGYQSGTQYLEASPSSR